MKKIGGILKKVVLVVVIVLVVLVIAAYLFGERAVRAGVETAASKALKVDVSLGGVQLGLLRGKVGLNDLVVDNPPGYSERNLLEMGGATVQTDLGSLLSDTVNIDLIRLDNIDLTIEQKGLSTNLKDLLDNIAASQPEPSATGGPEEKKEGGKKLLIKKLQISNVTVRVKVLGGPEIPLKLDTIEMENLGSDQKLDVAALTGKVLVAIAGGVAKQGAGVIPSDITGGLEAGLKSIQQLGGAVLEQGKDVLEKGAGAIKGIFKKDE